MDSYKKLTWLLRMGVDETVGEIPTNRLAKKTPVSVSTTQTTSVKSADDIALHQAIALAAEAQTLPDLFHALDSFDGCALKKTAMHTIFSKGIPNATVMCIGEMPDATDDKIGEPFSGESGILLDKMLRAIDLSISDNTYVSMLIPWRPPGNRKPTPTEIALCAPFMRRHIELVNPDILLLFGGLTSGALLGIDSISKARGTWHGYQPEGKPSPIPCLVTFSPTFLMKSPTHKKHAWEDLQRVRKKLDGQSD